METSKLDFLTSRKFWSLVCLSTATALVHLGFLDPAIMPAIQTFFGGYIGLNIYSKMAESLTAPTPSPTINLTPTE